MYWLKKISKNLESVFSFILFSSNHILGIYWGFSGIVRLVDGYSSYVFAIVILLEMYNEERAENVSSVKIWFFVL